MSRLGSLIALALVPVVGLTVACTSPTPSDPGTGGTGSGGSGTGGRGGRGGSAGGSTGGTAGGSTGGTTGGTTGGSAGGSGGAGTGGVTGGAGDAGTGGATGGAGGAGGSPGDAKPGETGSGGSGGMGGSGTGGSGGAGGSGMPSACDYTPKPAAMSRNLRFERINLANWPAGQAERPYNGGVTEVKFLPGTMDEVFITRKGGQIHHYKISGTSGTLVANMTVPNVATREDCGLIGMAFDPDFATNKFVFVGHCVGGGRDSRFMRYTYNNGTLTDGQQILAIAGGNASGNSWHSVGSMGFDKNKNLWMLHGEFVTGAPAQNPGSNLGKLHRVVPSRQAGMGGFMPAEGNPAATPVYALGLRSPWRGAYHPGKDWYFVAEVGPDGGAWEEINVVTRPGANLGWPNSTCNAGSVACWRTGLTVQKVMDSAALPDDDAGRAGRSAWVGPPYGDCGNDRYEGSLTGVVLGGDFFKGWVLGLTFDDAGAKTKDKSLGKFNMLSAVTQGPDGYLYVTKFGKYHQGAEEENVAAQGLYRVQLQ
jgi:Glucose / Sorbosone dehydrogenase